MAIITRVDKGSALSFDEMDNNFNELNFSPTGKTFPSAQDIGIQLSATTQGFGWHDLIGDINVPASNPSGATQTIYRGGIRVYQFLEGEDAQVNFHMPHDYVTGTDMFIHVHWSHNSTVVTGGTVTWGMEIMYAKGHNQASFEEPVLTPVTQSASTIQYRHMIAETPMSVVGGSAGVLIDTNNLEVDGVIAVRLYLDSNDILVSSGPKPDPFAHFVDVHYQSTGLATLNKAPDFWE